MPLPLLGIGMGISALGSLFGGHSQEQAGAQARQDALRRMGQIDPLLLQQMNQLGAQQLPWQSQLQTAMRGFSNPATSQGIDIASFLRNATYNTGQDALNQFLRADPTRQMAHVDDNLGQLADTGSPFDWQSVFGQALSNSDQYDTNRALAALHGSAGNLGQRFGTAMQQQTGDLLAQLANAQGVRNANLAQSSYEAAQGRRLSAAEALGQLGLNRNAQTLQGIQLGQGNAQQLAQLLQANLQNNQFNASTRNQIPLNMLQALQLGGNQMNQTSSLQNQLLGIMAGMQTPGPNPATGATGNALGDIGQGLALLPFMQSILAGKKS